VQKEIGIEVLILSIVCLMMVSNLLMPYGWLRSGGQIDVNPISPIDESTREVVSKQTFTSTTEMTILNSTDFDGFICLNIPVFDYDNVSCSFEIEALDYR